MTRIAVPLSLLALLALALAYALAWRLAQAIALRDFALTPAFAYADQAPPLAPRA